MRPDVQRISVCYTIVMQNVAHQTHKQHKQISVGAWLLPSLLLLVACLLLTSASCGRACDDVRALGSSVAVSLAGDASDLVCCFTTPHTVPDAPVQPMQPMSHMYHVCCHVALFLLPLALLLPLPLVLLRAPSGTLPRSVVLVPLSPPPQLLAR
jgi:hypothetical protein